MDNLNRFTKDMMTCVSRFRASTLRRILAKKWSPVSCEASKNRNAETCDAMTQNFSKPTLSGYASLLTMTLFMVPAFAGVMELEQGFNKLTSQSDGRVGICAIDVKTIEPTCVHGDQRFSLQSVMKLVVAAAVLDACDRKQLKLSDEVVLKPENASPGPQDFADIIRHAGELKVTVDELVHRSVIDSDSTSADFLIERLGGISAIHEFLKRNKIDGISIDRYERQLQTESLGLSWQPEYADFKKFKVAVSEVPARRRDAAWNEYLKDSRDTATPKGIVGFLKALASGKLLSDQSTRNLLDVMAKAQTGRDRLMAGTPKTWNLSHKTGTSPSWKGMVAATNDVGILIAPDGGMIAVAVFVAKSKRSNKDRASVIAEAAKLVAKTYEKYRFL